MAIVILENKYEAIEI